jgi:ribonuclease-3
MKNLENIIGYTFKDTLLLKQALTHSSAVGGICNERMEFLGDSILSVVVSEYLYHNLPNKAEGVLTKLRANLVCEEALYKYACKIELGARLTMGKGEEKAGGRNRKSVLSDAFEALIAAVYLDSKDSGLEKVRGFITPFLPDKKTLANGKFISGDYKTVLQELIQQNPGDVIAYVATNETGAEHEKVFFSSVTVNGKIAGTGSGRSKKESQQMAAKTALVKMGYAK